MKKNKKETFLEVINDSWEAIKVRQWLVELVPEKVKQEIIDRFNNEYKGKNEAKKG